MEISGMGIAVLILGAYHFRIGACNDDYFALDFFNDVSRMFGSCDGVCGDTQIHSGYDNSEKHNHASANLPIDFD